VIRGLLFADKHGPVGQPGVQDTRIPLECWPLRQASCGRSDRAFDGARFGTTQVLAVLAVSLIDQFPVDILAIDQIQPLLLDKTA